jgi:predicted unusual protein kinase regulating ubiquinone biosynthesis (AarF/ABC1/UbiB family)
MGLYMYQIMFLKVHADPHPGNLVNKENKLIAIDFWLHEKIPNFTILFWIDWQNAN